MVIGGDISFNKKSHRGIRNLELFFVFGMAYSGTRRRLEGHQLNVLYSTQREITVAC